MQTLSLSLPAVITTDLRLNEPRYASLPNIMKAKKKLWIPSLLKELGVDLGNSIESLGVENTPRTTSRRNSGQCRRTGRKTSQ